MGNELVTIAVLRMRAPDQPERLFRMVEGQTLQVGRDSDNDIVLKDPTVSRVHATFSARRSGVVVNDMFSRNGTFINGERLVANRELVLGDVVDIGASKFVVEEEGMSEAGTGTGTMPEIVTAQLVPVRVTVLLLTLIETGDQKVLVDDRVESVMKVWIEMVRPLIQKEDGDVDKVTGASIMAHWSGEDEGKLAVAACNAAVAIRQNIPKLITALRQKLQLETELKVALVISSGMGLKRLMDTGTSIKVGDFIILGDPAKVAFCLQEVMGQVGYDLIMPESTALLIKSKFKVRRAFSMALKGSEGLISAYTLE